ncbi:helix-turn-helix transcriptional regulator [Peptostreptococcus russellii]|uniref:helix-turn-helix transcriptional regulator n=1 Tax=Peptostreptococcus russellii TaxID=215200 RepID=UPI003F586F75
MYKNLSNKRKEKQYTLEEMAKYLGISKSSYYKKEIGEIKISLSEAKKLADFFEINIEALFFNNEVS